MSVLVEDTSESITSADVEVYCQRIGGVWPSRKWLDYERIGDRSAPSGRVLLSRAVWAAPPAIG
jgi:hypothetical protein